MIFQPASGLIRSPELVEPGDKMLNSSRQHVESVSLLLSIHNLSPLRYFPEAFRAEQTVKGCAGKAAACCPDPGGNASSPDPMGPGRSNRRRSRECTSPKGAAKL